MGERIYFAAGEGDDGDSATGLVALAEAACKLGRDAAVVAPENSEVTRLALSFGLPVVEIHSANRRQYLGKLRAWDKAARKGLLWCNGLVPALATSGRRRRVAYLQKTLKRSKYLAWQLATTGVEAVIAPTRFTAAQLPNVEVLPNLVPKIAVIREPPGRVPAMIGFLGKPTIANGGGVLCTAISRLNRYQFDRARLIIAEDLYFDPSVEQVQLVKSFTALGHNISIKSGLTIEQFLEQVDLIVFPALVANEFIFQVAQVMSARVPLVVSDVGVLPEIVGSQYSRLVAAGDPIELSRVMEDTLNDWSTTVTELAYERWKEHYSPDAFTQRLLTLFERLGL